ncbi:MAG: chemosensory pili system protein ChpA (sensor histidine kinase/response regulator) [Parcubacteria bacterium C7867-007]|nr:MAG: chemosensory pili system protein ChpA (sensor histidine kinase/response regulator) [Parcubacteria bacterium C7867-007]
MADTKFILVVEDDPILKNLLGHTFAGKYQTLYASNGAEALALINQYTPAVVLLDLMLPDMDGFTILKTIRERADAAKSVPVIIVSNLGQQSDKDRALSIGANDYIVKAEVDIEEIVGRIEKMLEPSGAVPSVPVAATDPTLVSQVPEPMSIPTAPGPIAMAMPVSPAPMPAPVAEVPMPQSAAPMPEAIPVVAVPEPTAPIAMAMPEAAPMMPAPPVPPAMPDPLSGLMPSNPEAAMTEGTQEKPFIV